MQPRALSQPSKWTYGPTCRRCCGLRGYSAAPTTLSLCWYFPLYLPISTAMGAHSCEQVGPFFLLGIFPLCAARRAARVPSDISCPSLGAALAVDELRRAYNAARPAPPLVSADAFSHFVTMGINYCSLEHKVDKVISYILHYPPDVACL